MRRLFWVAAGAAAGVLVVQKLSKRARAFTPAGVGGAVTKGVSGVRNLAREFVEDVMSAAAEKEDELLALMSGKPAGSGAEQLSWYDQAEEIFGDLGKPRKGER